MKRIVVLVLLLVVLSGCQMGLFQRKSTTQLPEVSFGTQGVELSFAPGSPPHEVYEGSPFNLLVTLSNLGTMDVDDGVFALSYEQQYLFLGKQSNIGRFSTRGKSVFNPQGEERQINFVLTSKSLGPQLERYPTTLTFSACYPYTTSAPIITCIDGDVMNKNPRKVCMPQTQAFPQGQGAPVVVATVETRMLPHELPNRVRPEFILTLQNKGRGSVVATNYYREACSGRPLGDESWNMVDVTAELSDTLLTCTPGTVKLRQTGDTRVVCTLPEGIDTRLGTFTEQLKVFLDYGYLTSITTQTTIVRPNV